MSISVLAESKPLCHRKLIEFAKLESRTAESIKMDTQADRSAENKSTDLIICVVSYKETTNKEHKEPREKEETFSQVW